ncbi:MAG: electron transport complex protein RnfA [Oscillospiraceae bacterium]
MKMAFIFFSVILVNNFVLTKFLGVESFLNASRKVKPVIALSSLLTVVMVIATALCWPLYTFVLLPAGLDFMSNLLFIIIITAILYLIAFLLHQFVPALYTAFKEHLPMVITNGVVLGVLFLSVYTPGGALIGYTFAEALVYALGAGIGFGVAMLLFCAVQRRLVLAKPPKAFQGIPITLISAAITSLAFMGFSGLLENLFGIVA